MFYLEHPSLHKKKIIKITPILANMASIRKRLSQIWRRSGEKETPGGDEQRSSTHRDSISSVDSGYSSVTSHGTIDSAQPATPKNLHKAASMTFQSFSDTIRSKTRAFYVSPERSDTKSCDHTEDTPKSHQPRSSRILSSVMSHEGYVALESRLESGRSSPTPIPRAAKSQWTTPTIDVTIPDSFLTDSEISGDNALKSSVEMPCQAPTIATLKPYGPWQLWPTPIDVALQQFSKIDLKSTGIPRSPMINDPNVNSSEDFIYDSAMFDPDSRIVPPVPEDQNPNIKDSCGSTNFHDTAIVTELKSPDLGLGSPSSPLLDTDAATKGKQRSNSLLLNGDQANFQGTHVTWLLPEQFRNEANATGMVSEGLDSSSQPYQADIPCPYPTTTQRPIFHRTISHKTGLRDLFAASNSFLNHDGKKHRTRQASSSVYDSDDEPEAPSAEVPRMGSRREWDKVRADRYNRYSAIRFLDEDEITEGDSEFGLEIEKSPSRRPLEDALCIVTGFDTNDIDQDASLSFANDEVANSPEKWLESNHKSNPHAFETTTENLSQQNLGLSEGFRSDLAEGDLGQGFDASEWWSSLEWLPSLEWQPPSQWSLSLEWLSHPNPLRAAPSVDAEAALHRLGDSRLDWSIGSSYDSEDELYTQYERPSSATSLPALLAPLEDDEDHKKASTEEPDPGFASSAYQSETLDYSLTENSEETDPYGYYSLGSSEVWSHSSKMDALDRTMMLEVEALDENDECTEDIEGILSENECSPLDESPVYFNPTPFPDLKKYGDDDNHPSSMITEDTLADQTDRLGLLAKHEAHPSSISPSFPDNACEGFWADLRLDLKDYSMECQNSEENGQSGGEHDTKNILGFYGDIMKEIDETRNLKHEFDDPDRTFNAAKLPKFNPIPSSALEKLVEVQEKVCKVDSPGSPGIKKENKTNSPGTNGHLRCTRKKPPVNKIGSSPSKPQDRRDATSPGKKVVCWANDVEYIEKFSPTLSEKSDGSKRREKTNRSKLVLSIPKQPAPRHVPYRLRKPGDMGNFPTYVTDPSYVTEGPDW